MPDEPSIFLEFMKYPALGAIIGALIGSLTTVFVLYLSASRADKNKKRERRREIEIFRSDEQIGKLYAPLSGLLQQLAKIAQIKDEMALQDPERAAEIQKKAYDVYFHPIHLKIMDILENQLHLLENDDIPRSFSFYYQHVSSERVFFSFIEQMATGHTNGNLAEATKMIRFRPERFPAEFPRDIQAGFKKVLERQEKLLRSLDRDRDYE